MFKYSSKGSTCCIDFAPMGVGAYKRSDKHYEL